MTLTQRRTFVDIAKGLTILLVVVEHNTFIYKYHILTQVLILSFHMPLFYFVSGLFFSEKTGISLLVKKRLHSLAKPYFFSCLLFFCLKSIKLHQIDNFISFVCGVLYGTAGSLSWPYQQLWFLTSLFVTVLFCGILYRYVMIKIGFKWLRLIILVLFLFAGILLARSRLGFSLGGLPWNIDLLGVTLFFYALGFEMHQWLFYLDRNKVLIYCLFVFFIFFGLHYFFTYRLNDPYAMNLSLRKYDSLYVNSLEAVSGIILVVLLSAGMTFFSALSVAGNILSFIGQRSLAVFIFHVLFMSYIGRAGKLFFSTDSAVLFILTISLTLAISLAVHEVIVRIPVLRSLLLNYQVINA
jgi:fucose 4-O-acetylase-like acetyltransferase